MSFWSNIQAVRIGRGVDWKNRWIPPVKKFYKNYLLHDLLLHKYIWLKVKQDDNLNISFMYNYDFFFEKTFFYTKIILERYNIDLSRLSQLAYVAWINMLNFGSNLAEDNKFYRTTIFNEWFINFFFWPLFFFYNFNLFLLKKSVYEIKNEFEFTKELPFNQWKLLLGLKSSFFFVENFFFKPNNFFFKSSLLSYKNLEMNYDSYNVPKEIFFTNYLEVYRNRFTLANFLFNPTILKKYPNFIFLYQNWLHKSWISSKKTTLISVKLAHAYTNITKTILINMDYFYSWYIWFFFFMWQINLFFQGTDESGVGISKEFLTKQKEIFYLRLKIRDIMIYSIRKVWFYLKAYLKYFSYEGKIRIFWSKLVFKWFFFFKNFLRNFVSGYKFSANSFFVLLRNIYVIKYFWFTKFLKLMNIFFKTPIYLKNWSFFLNKIFFKYIKFLKKIFKWWKISFFKKLELINGLFNFFMFKFGLSKKIFGYFIPIYKYSIKFILFKLGLNFKLVNLENLKKIPITINLLIILFLFNLFRVPSKDYYSTLIEFQNFFERKINLDKNTFSSFWKFVEFGKNFNNAKMVVSDSDWLLPCLVKPVTLKFFYSYIYFKRILWFKKFVYFYYCLSNLSIKTFFWFFTDLLSLTNFNLLVHLVIIFWQNFFFFYLFVLKCLRNMYYLCDKNKQLFLSWPIKLFLQKTNWETVMLDFFSNSFKYFGPFLPISFWSSLWEDKVAFTLIDFAYGLAQLGKPNCWMLKNTKNFVNFNKFSLFDKISDSPIFLPFFNITFSTKISFWKNFILCFDKKYNSNINFNFFSSRIPTHIKIKYFSNLHLTANLIATFIKKKLEKDHLVAEILKSLNLLLLQSDTIWGFMFLLKGRFSRKERASKVWLKKGKLNQTNIWTKLDYCKLSAKLKYGTASVWVWLVIETSLDDKVAFV